VPTIALDTTQIRQDFPILSRQVQGKPLVYLDNAATSQKPQQVLDASTNYYTGSNANVHRGVHTLSDEATRAWEESRTTIAEFFGAQPENLIISRNTTEALNGVAYGWAAHHLKPGDIVLASLLEHHSNLVPWQEVCKRTGATLQIIPVTSEGIIDTEWYQKHLTPAVKLVALSHVSNVLGTVTDVAWFADLAHEMGARVVVDGAQAAPHLPINFSKLGVDFYAFSGHKMLGPMGAGGLLVRRELLESGEFQPWLFGGGMIAEVATTHSTFQEDPSERFTAGTPDVASAVGLAAACKYLTNLDMQQVLEHDFALVQYAYTALQNIPQVQLVGPVPHDFGNPPNFASTSTSTSTSTSAISTSTSTSTSTSAISTTFASTNTALQTKYSRLGSVAFIYKNVHAHDVAQVLDSQGIAVRSGHHCTMPLHTHFKWQATTRVSFQVYNDAADIDTLVTGLEKVAQTFGV
jgi:cysteine desulfurase / selenocysteine lyase